MSGKAPTSDFLPPKERRHEHPGTALSVSLPLSSSPTQTAIQDFYKPSEEKSANIYPSAQPSPSGRANFVWQTPATYLRRRSRQSHKFAPLDQTWASFSWYFPFNCADPRRAKAFLGSPSPTQGGCSISTFLSDFSNFFPHSF